MPVLSDKWIKKMALEHSMISPFEGKQIREGKSGSCYASGSDKRLLFGLGQKDRVDFVQINWPSGIIQTLENVVANQIMTITESK